MALSRWCIAPAHLSHLYFDGTPRTHNGCTWWSWWVVVQLWDMRSQQCENTFIEHTDGVWSIQYEDNELVSASRGALHFLMGFLLSIPTKLTPLVCCGTWRMQTPR